jgi:hypothetical protein
MAAAVAATVFAVAVAVIVAGRHSLPDYHDQRADNDRAGRTDGEHCAAGVAAAMLPDHAHPQAKLMQAAHDRADRLAEQGRAVDLDPAASGIGDRP